MGNQSRHCQQGDLAWWEKGLCCSKITASSGSGDSIVVVEILKSCIDYWLLLRHNKLSYLADVLSYFYIEKIIELTSTLTGALLAFQLLQFAQLSSAAMTLFDSWAHQKEALKNVSIHFRYARSGPPLRLVHGNPEHCRDAALGPPRPLHPAATVPGAGRAHGICGIVGRKRRGISAV
ncbi:hypothetical protein BJ546DRAFT_946144 [Cryomyces antarcticus]